LSLYPTANRVIGSYKWDSKVTAIKVNDPYVSVESTLSIFDEKVTLFGNSLNSQFQVSP